MITCSSSIFGCSPGLAREPFSAPGFFSSSPAPRVAACVLRLSECPAELDYCGWYCMKQATCYVCWKLCWILYAESPCKVSPRTVVQLYMLIIYADCWLLIIYTDCYLSERKKCHLEITWSVSPRTVVCSISSKSKRKATCRLRARPVLGSERRNRRRSLIPSIVFPYTWIFYIFFIFIIVF